MTFIDIWITFPDRATADVAAKICVGEKLAACANILAPVSSIYRWQGAIERAEEVPLILKTRASLFDAVAERVRAMHPYEVPSIIAVEMAAVDKAYAEWLEAETREA